MTGQKAVIEKDVATATAMFRSLIEAGAGPDRAAAIARSMIPKIYCWRCGALAEVHGPMIDTTALNSPFSTSIPARGVTCPTPGCRHWDGTSATTALPPTPDDLLRAAGQAMDRLWAIRLDERRPAVDTSWITMETIGSPNWVGWLLATGFLVLMVVAGLYSWWATVHT